MGRLGNHCFHKRNFKGSNSCVLGWFWASWTCLTQLDLLMPPASVMLPKEGWGRRDGSVFRVPQLPSKCPNIQGVYQVTDNKLQVCSRGCFYRNCRKSMRISIYPVSITRSSCDDRWFDANKCSKVDKTARSKYDG